MNTRCRALFVGTSLLTTTLALTACDSVYTSMAQSRFESNARARNAHYAAQGNPQFSDPQLRAVVQDFEAKYAVIGTDPEKLGLAEGKPCAVTKDVAFKVLFGFTPEEYEKAKLDVASKFANYTDIYDVDAVRVVLLSGTCGENGPKGPAEIVGTTRNITRFRGEGYSDVTVIDRVTRIKATWEDGQRRDLREMIDISHSVRFKETDDGQLAEDISDWDYANAMRDAPSATYTYIVPKADGTPKYVVTFTRDTVSGIYSTGVREYLDSHRTYSRRWQGTELVNEGGQKDGKAHGWSITHPTVYNGTEIPGRRDCYQNGELIKALECPST